MPFWNRNKSSKVSDIKAKKESKTTSPENTTSDAGTDDINSSFLEIDTSEFDVDDAELFREMNSTLDGGKGDIDSSSLQIDTSEFDVDDAELLREMEKLGFNSDPSGDVKPENDTVLKESNSLAINDEEILKKTEELSVVSDQSMDQKSDNTEKNSKNEDAVLKESNSLPIDDEDKLKEIEDLDFTSDQLEDLKSTTAVENDTRLDTPLEKVGISATDEEMEEHLNLNLPEDVVKEYKQIQKEQGLIESGNEHDSERNTQDTGMEIRTYQDDIQETKSVNLQENNEALNIESLEKEIETHKQRAFDLGKKGEKELALEEVKKFQHLQKLLDTKIQENKKLKSTSDNNKEIQAQVSAILTEEGTVSTGTNFHGVPNGGSSTVSDSQATRRNSTTHEEQLLETRMKKIEELDKLLQKKMLELKKIKKEGTLDTDYGKKVEAECRAILRNKRKIGALVEQKELEIKKRNANSNSTLLKKSASTKSEKSKEQLNKKKENEAKGTLSSNVIIDPAQSAAYELIEEKVTEFMERHRRKVKELEQKKQIREAIEEAKIFKEYKQKLEELRQKKLIPGQFPPTFNIKQEICSKSIKVLDEIDENQMHVIIMDGEGFFEQERSSKEKIKISYQIKDDENTYESGVVESIEGEPTFFNHSDLISFSRPKRPRENKRLSSLLKKFERSFIKFTVFKEEANGWFSKNYVPVSQTSMPLRPLLTKCESSQRLQFHRVGGSSSSSHATFPQSYLNITLRVRIPIAEDEIIEHVVEKLVFGTYPPLYNSVQVPIPSKLDSQKNQDVPSSSLSSSSIGHVRKSNDPRNKKSIQNPKTSADIRKYPLVKTPLPPELEDVGVKALEDPFSFDLLRSIGAIEYELSLLSQITESGTRNLNYNPDKLSPQQLGLRKQGLENMIQELQNACGQGLISPEDYLYAIREAHSKDLKIIRYLAMNGRKPEALRMKERMLRMEAELKEGEQF